MKPGKSFQLFCVYLPGVANKESAVEVFPTHVFKFPKGFGLTWTWLQSHAVDDANILLASLLFSNGSQNKNV